MANEKNLRPGEYKFTEEDRKKALEKRLENSKNRQSFREIFDALLGKKVKGKDGQEITIAEAMAMKQVEKALKGDPKAFEISRDTAGEKPVDKVMIAELDQSVIDEVERAVLDE